MSKVAFLELEIVTLPISVLRRISAKCGAPRSASAKALVSGVNPCSDVIINIHTHAVHNIGIPDAPVSINQVESVCQSQLASFRASMMSSNTNDVDIN